MSIHEKKSKNFLQKKSTYIIGLIILLLIIGIPVVTGANKPKVNPNYYTATKLDLQKYIKDSSSLQPNDIRKVSGQTGAKITEILVKAGSDVTQGQVIAKTDFNGKITEIKSPIAGTVVKLNYNVEETVGQNEIFQVADLTSLKIVSTVSANEINNVKVDQTVKIKINSLDSEKEYDGKVTTVENFSNLNAANEYSSNYRVTIKLNEKPVNAITGMKASVVIYGDKQDNAIVVENNRILQKGDGAKYIKRVDWINKDQNLFTLRETKVTTGLEGDKVTEIISGVNEGDQIAQINDNSVPTPGFSLIPPR
jgi:multidrug efflux pump subunit AcrA (membrane-fusion protein)